MKKVSLAVCSLLCTMLFAGCAVYTTSKSQPVAGLPDGWQDRVKERMAPLAPYGKPDEIILVGDPEPCKFEVAPKYWGYCGKVDIVGGYSKRYFISQSNVVWLINADGLESLPPNWR